MAELPKGPHAQTCSVAQPAPRPGLVRKASRHRRATRRPGLDRLKTQRAATVLSGRDASRPACLASYRARTTIIGRFGNTSRLSAAMPVTREGALQ